MKLRIFRKCINRKKDYKHFPKYTHKILGIGLGENTKYICGKAHAEWQNGKFVVTIIDNLKFENTIACHTYH